MSFWYNKAAQMILGGTLNLTSSTLKVMLCNASYLPDRDEDYIDHGSGSDAHTNEIDPTSGYVRGFNGSGRMTLLNKTFIEDKSDDKSYFRADDLTWTLGTGATVTQAIVIKEGTSDTDSILVLLLTGFSVITNGGTFTLQFDDLLGLGYFQTD